MMTKIICILLPLALAGCASAPATQQGSSEVVNGVEVWKGGEPARPYEVIAKVNKEGADSSVSYEDLEAAIAREAARQGADGVIVETTAMAVSRLDLASGRSVLAPEVVAEVIKYR